MGDQCLTRQTKRHPAHARFAEKCHGPGGIDECNIARDKPHSLVILDYRRFAGKLKQSKIMIQAVETNVALCPPAAVRIRTDIPRREPVYVQGVRPAVKGLRRDGFGAISSAKPLDQIFPRLEIL